MMQLISIGQEVGVGTRFGTSRYLVELKTFFEMGRFDLSRSGTGCRKTLLF